MAKWYPLKKIERQLLIYHIFIHNICVEYDTIKYWLKLKDNQIRTFYRDLKELNDSGLISTIYNHELKGYTNDGASDLNPDATGRYRSHLVRLRRVGTCMTELVQDEVDETFLDAQIYDKEWWKEEMGDEYYIDVKSLDSCKDCYKRLFPDTGERTMQRDFQLLNRIGYTIEYNPNYHYYRQEFPDFEELPVDIKNENGKLFILS